LRRPTLVAGILVVTLGVDALLSYLLADRVANPDTWRVWSIAALLAIVASIPVVLSLVFLDRREREPLTGVIGVTLWGALGATVVSAALSGAASRSLIAAFANTPEIESLIGAGLGFAEVLETLDWVPTVLVAPWVEETVKVVGLFVAMWLMRGRVRGMRDGFVLGAFVGIGFAIVEMGVYVVWDWGGQGNPPYAWELGTRYALLGFNGHALWTGLAGAGLGLSRTLVGREAKSAAFLAGYLLALVAHATRNALSTPISVAVSGLLGLEQGQTVPLATLWFTSATTWFLLEAPFLVAILMVIIWSDRWERDTIHRGLLLESSPIVTESELRSAANVGFWDGRRADGLEGARSADLVNLQNRLALRRWSAESAGIDPDTEPGIEAMRSEIVQLRVDPQTGTPTPT
jgi:RsiW-degrading membrane proteinase PrsW (M82 family)